MPFGRLPSGAKAPLFVGAYSARLKSCPFKASIRPISCVASNINLKLDLHGEGVDLGFGEFGELGGGGLALGGEGGGGFAVCLRRLHRAPHAVS